MLSIVTSDGRFKKPAMAYRTHGSEFLVYETDFGKFKWEDLYANRVCILNVKPTRHVHEDLQSLLDKNYSDYILVSVII
jgi:hypothetical protein